ncbi:P-loop containing nucleoside triphosphate hydrolase protein [Aspergillus ambiguus]|uniref:putative dynamin GTPase n=1 Tax=Aspergillus ambiguus TaxID=176160 RepID=UPI003CCCFCEE
MGDLFNLPEHPKSRPSSSDTSTTAHVSVNMPTLNMDAISALAGDMKTLVKKIQDLRHIGIEDSSIALPKICVIGDQSTGKSSLIEGMSEIKVPRSSGTCTRCPMEINLAESDQDWTCRIYLSRKYMFDSSQRLVKPKRSKPLGPWIEQDVEDELFVTLHDKDATQDAIMWAQIAILNPGRASTDYTPGQNHGIDTSCQVKFSPNVVRLDISAPSFPNLSFYDLPGVISQAEFDEEKYLVSLVENLVREYISQENCIVLLALPMTDDATNSSAARIMRDVPGAKQRTLGVLTKPDRIQSGESYNQWIEILEGGKFSLGHGYYVVRNNHDPAIPHAQARDEEDAFFATSPWTTDLTAYQTKFGTRRLQTALSNLLLDQIQGCLPRIIEQIADKAKRVEDELKTLPDPPSTNVQYILCTCLHELKDRIRAHLDGGSSKYPLQKTWGGLAKDFQRALIKTRPTVSLLAEHERVLPVAQNHDSDCEVTSVQQAPTKRKASTQTDIRRDQTTPVSPESNLKRVKLESPEYSTEQFQRFNKPARMFTWTEIKGINEDSYRAGIPDQADPKAVEILCQLSVAHWYEPMDIFLEATHKLVRQVLVAQLKVVFKDYYQTSLYRELKRIITGYLTALEGEHLRHAQEIYQIEYNKPFTMAMTILEKTTKEAQKLLQDRRRDARVISYLKMQGRVLKDDNRREAEIQKVIGELGPDCYAQEVRMMAATRGYYDVASARFVDSICQGVYTKLFLKCREELIPTIEHGLGIFNDNAYERCQELMAEDVERQRRRQYLLREKEKVNQAQRWLSAVKEDDGDDDSMFCH